MKSSNSRYGGATTYVTYFGDDTRLLPLFEDPVQLKTGEITFLRILIKEVCTVDSFNFNDFNRFCVKWL